MTLAIRRIGTAVPDTVIDQEAALYIARALAHGTAEQESWLPGMYEGTGIRARRLSLSEQVVRDMFDKTNTSGSPYLPSGADDDRGPDTGVRMEHYAKLAPPLALSACLRAIDGSGLSPRDFTHLVTVSCTGFVAPGLDHHLIHALGMRPTTERTHVGFMGCHGALNGLRVANAFGHDPRAKVLLCAVELCSLHLHYGYNPQKMVANAIFGDGAAAVVAEGVGEGHAEPWSVIATGSCYLPDSAHMMSWEIGANGFEMGLSRSVPALIGKHLRPWLESWLAESSLRVEDVREWIVHPGGPKILDAAEDAIGLDRNRTTLSREVFAEFGNMSSPTVLFVLDRLMKAGGRGPAVMLGFGPGLVAEGVVLG